MNQVNQIEKLEEIISRFVNLEKCEESDPCAEDHTCRIHKIRWFLRKGKEAVQRGDFSDKPGRCGAMHSLEKDRRLVRWVFGVLNGKHLEYDDGLYQGLSRLLDGRQWNEFPAQENPGR